MNKQISYDWLACPACGHPKLMKVRSDTKAVNIIVYCKRCKKENLIDIK